MADDFSRPRRGPASPRFDALRGRRLLIALSGGVDSVALAAMLAEARDALDLTLFAAHLDHGIRPESAEDAAFCRELCARLGIGFYTARVDVPAIAARTGEGLESAARRERYAFLRDCKMKADADCIALAHHMDDQAETVLMHLARGTGPEGIGGMAEYSGDLVRPLLGVRKRELVEWLASRGLVWREDKTNAVADNPRNALRMHGIPALEQSYPQFVEAAARYAESARIESDYVAAQARAWLDANMERGPYGLRLRLMDMPHPAILRRAIRAACGGDIGFDRLAAVEALARSKTGATEIAGGRRVERGHRCLYILRREAPTMRETPLALAGKTILPGICAIEASTARPLPIRGDPMRQALDADALEGAVVRARRPGDRFRPLGCGERLLSDFLTDRKVDRPLRDHIALVARENRVLWVCGFGISEDVKITEDTERAIGLECHYVFNIDS